MGRQHIHIQPMLAKRRIKRPHMRAVLEAGRLRLDIPRPFALIVEDERNAALGSRASDPRGGKFFGDLLGLEIGGSRLAIGTVQAGMHLFLCEGRLTPAEVGDDFGTVCKGLPCP